MPHFLNSAVRLELPRGMRDLEPEEYYNINYIKEKFLETTSLFNFKLMEPSPLEMLATLEVKSGGASISNEIYSFTDNGGRNVALRFDLTIGLTRFVTSRRDLKMPFKVAAFAGVWRYDEPQSGRYRYFHQCDVEVYGPFREEADTEVIEFISVFLKKIGLNVVIEINDRQLIEEYIRQRLGVSDEQMILEMFRAMDKVPKKGTRAVQEEYKDKIEFSKLQSLIDLSCIKGTADQVYSKGNIKELTSWRKLTGLMDSLKARKVDNVRVNLGIVRGLDYYSGIVFEAFDLSLDIGALVGGGRYDTLTDAFGRKDIGATGAAGGIERIAMALQKHGILKHIQKPLVYVAYTSDNVRNEALQIISKLRNNGIIVDYDIQGRTLRRQLDDASTKEAVITVIVAPEEVADRQVTVRSMKDGIESKQNVDELAKTVSKMLY